MDWNKWLEIEWLLSAEHMFTMVTVILSALISWGISAWYFHRGNRNALRANVIYPIKRLLDDKYSGKRYAELSELSKKYENKYLSKKELKVLDQLILSYRQAYQESIEYIYAESLFSYFCFKLRQNNIDPQPVPIKDNEGNHVDYTYPDDIFYLRRKLFEIMQHTSFEYDEESSQQEVQDAFDFYCKQCYTEESITYFDDYRISEVLEKSHVHSDWIEKQNTYKACKQEFLELKIVCK